MLSMSKMIEIPRGDSIFVTFESPIPIDDRTVKFTVKQDTKDPDTQAIIQHSTNDGGIEVVSVEDRLVRLALDPGDTVGLSPRDYFYDVKVIWTDGGRLRRKTIVHDRFKVLPVVYRGENS